MTEEMKIEIVAGLTHIFANSISEIVLYGSVARGTQTDESDIDIAIILQKPMNLREREKFIEWSTEMDFKYDCVLSVIDIDEAKINQWGDSLPFYRNVRKEGVSLWKAA